MTSLIPSLKINPIEVLLGLGLGFGYMTSLRFFGPVGIAELMVLTSLIMLFQNHGKSLFRYEKNLAGWIKIYMIFCVYLLLPVITLISSILLGLPTKPEYIISFMMGISLAFLLVESLRSQRIEMSRIVLWFAFGYIFSNVVTLLFFPASLHHFVEEKQTDSERITVSYNLNCPHMNPQMNY